MNRIVKPGRLIMLTEGAYSSHSTMGWFVCVQEFCPGNRLVAFLQENPGQRADYQFKNAEFLAWLLKQGLIAEAAEFFDTWHLADYGTAREVEYFPRESDNG